MLQILIPTSFSELRPEFSAQAPQCLISGVSHSEPVWNSCPAPLCTATPYLVSTSWIHSNLLCGAVYGPSGRTMTHLWLRVLCPWDFVLLSWCLLYAQNVFPSLLNCNLPNNYIYQLFSFLHPKASARLCIQHSKNVMNEQMSFREKPRLLIWCSKNKGILEILIHARASRFPWIPGWTGKCKGSVTPLTSYFSSSPLWWVYYAVLMLRPRMCISWTRCFTIFVGGQICPAWRS